MATTDKTRVMVVDDSPYMRKLLSDIIKSSPRLEVSITAQDGADAIRKLGRSQPDVIVLDLEMPNMDGLTFLEKIMKERPIPVVIVSSYAQNGAEIVLDALECGAVDFVPIPLSERYAPEQLRSSLTSKILVAGRANPSLLRPRRIERTSVAAKLPFEGVGSSSKVVVIGASTGGPRVLGSVIPALPGDLPAGLLVIQHMPKVFTMKLAQRLNEISKLRVKEAEDGDAIEAGTALLAPGDCHMLVKQSRCVKLDHGPKRLGASPSVNVSMITASEVYRSKTVGVLLSGMGQDGAFGMKMIKKRGGTTIAQDETSSIVFGMAKQAQKLEAVDRLVPDERIPEEIARAARPDV